MLQILSSKVHIQLYTMFCINTSILGLTRFSYFQALKLNDQVDCTNFTVDMLDRHDFLNKLHFSDEVTFLVSRVVNGYKCRILGNKNPHVTGQLETDSAKMNVWCCLMHDTVIRTYFFSELTVTWA